MNDSEFKALSEKALTRIEQGLEAAATDLDFSRTDDGVLEIELPEAHTVIVNRHAASQELWVAARTGAHHYRWDGEHWRNTRDQCELFAQLSILLSGLSGEDIQLH